MKLRAICEMSRYWSSFRSSSWVRPRWVPRVFTRSKHTSVDEQVIVAERLRLDAELTIQMNRRMNLMKLINGCSSLTIPIDSGDTTSSLTSIETLRTEAKQAFCE